MNRVTGRMGLALALLLAAAGCSVSNVKPDFALNPSSGKGLVVASLTRTGVLDFSIELRTRAVNGGLEKSIPLDDYVTPRDWSKVSYGPHAAYNDTGHGTTVDPVGRLLVAELPAGEYEIFGFTGQSPPLGSAVVHERYYLASGPFSLKFTVRPGEVTYLGDIQVQFPDWINAMQYQGNFHIAISDTQARDFALLNEKYPAAHIAPASRTLVAETDLSKPIPYYLWINMDGGDKSSGM